MANLFDQVSEAADSIRNRWNSVPRVGIILGTGLGDLARQIAVDVAIPYGDIPHFAVSTVESHAGRLICGRIGTLPVVAMEGRVHFYEGHSMRQVTFPVRVMKALGAATLFITNAAGGMNPGYELADIVLIDDHINLLPDNPLRGENDDRLGPRFPDMSRPYDPKLLAAAEQAAKELGIAAYRGVMVAVAGPNLETRAEYRMLRHMGADVVGMSTVPEVIVAVHAGMRVLGCSIVTDLCFPDTLEPAAIDKIVTTAARGGKQLERLLLHLCERFDTL